MIEDALFSILRPWLMQAAGCEVILANPDAPIVPSGAYISVQLIHSENLHPPTMMEYEEDDTAPIFPPFETGETPGPTGYPPLFQVPVYEREWTYSVNIYASDPIDIGHRISAWTESDAASLLLYPLSAQPVAQIRRLPEWIEGKWVGRAQLDLNVRGIVANGSLINEDGNKVIVGRVPLNEILEGTISFSPTFDPELEISGEYTKPGETDP